MDGIKSTTTWFETNILGYAASEFAEAGGGNQVALPAFFEEEVAKRLTGDCGKFINDLINKASEIIGYTGNAERYKKAFSKNVPELLDTILRQDGISVRSHPSRRVESAQGWVDQSVGGYASGSIIAGNAGIVLAARYHLKDSSWLRSLPEKLGMQLQVDAIKRAHDGYITDLIHETTHHAYGGLTDLVLSQAAAKLGYISPEALSKIDPTNKDLSASRAWDNVLREKCGPK